MNRTAIGTAEKSVSRDLDHRTRYERSNKITSEAEYLTELAPALAEGLPTTTVYVLRARSQCVAFAAFGVFFNLLGVSFVLWGRDAGSSRGLALVLALLASCVAVGNPRAAERPDAGGNPTSSYALVLCGAVVVAVVLALFEPDTWAIPGVLLCLAAAVAYLAALERTQVGMSTALAIAAFAAGFALSTMSQAALLAACLGAMLLSAAVALSLAPNTR